MILISDGFLWLLKLNFIRKGEITCKIIIPSSVCVSVVSSALTNVILVVSPTDVTSSSPVVVGELVWITVKVTVTVLHWTFR